MLGKVFNIKDEVPAPVNKIVLTVSMKCYNKILKIWFNFAIEN